MYRGTWVHWDEDSRHIIMSAGKSLTSACIGIAIKEGFIESVDQSIFDYLPDHQYLNTDGKDAITIEHLLTMTSGLAWDEWGASYLSPENDATRCYTQRDDLIACVLEMPLVSEPGEDYTYTGGGMTVLGEIIKNATGMDIEAFANKYLFTPLGIDPVEWRRFDSGIIYGGGEQYLTPREMVKFGVTYLNDGVWDGRQIISEQWVEKSATPYPGPDNSWFNHFLRPIPPSDSTWGPRGYAYNWWTHQFSDSGEKIPVFYASGWGDQNIFVIPDQNAVVVFTGGNYSSMKTVIKILKGYVIPALNE
jgi:CubicO group peptidase (beta-lactamase class C family)